jgi:phage-related protein
MCSAFGESCENRLSEFHTSHTGVKELYRRFLQSVSDLGVIPYERSAQSTAVICEFHENRLSEFHTSHTGVKKIYRRFPQSLSDLVVIPYERSPQSIAVICEFHENRHVESHTFPIGVCEFTCTGNLVTF